MNTRTERVFHGFTQLTSSEQSELIEEIRRYIEASPMEKRSMRDQIDLAIKMELGPVSDKMEVGPVSEVCVCCGK